jgi:hypothetical protein
VNLSVHCGDRCAWRGVETDRNSWFADHKLRKTGAGKRLSRLELFLVFTYEKARSDGSDRCREGADCNRDRSVAAALGKWGAYGLPIFFGTPLVAYDRSRQSRVNTLSGEVQSRCFPFFFFVFARPL